MSMERVIQVDIPMVQILFTRLLDGRTDAHTLQVAAMRIARLLLEHAMSAFPTRAAEIPLAGSSSSSYYLGVEFAKPTCTISLKSESGGDGGGRSPFLLLRESQAIELNARVDCIGSVSTKSDAQVQLLPNLCEHNILVLVDSMGGACSSQQLARPIQTLLCAGAAQSDIYFVTLCSCQSTLLHLLEMFPRVRIVTAKASLLRGALPSATNDQVVERVHSRLQGLQ